MVKIRYELVPPYHIKHRKGPVRKGYCKWCGSKLSNDRSIEIGIGKRCRKQDCKMIFEIIPDNPAN